MATNDYEVPMGYVLIELEEYRELLMFRGSKADAWDLKYENENLNAENEELNAKTKLLEEKIKKLEASGDEENEIV